jgi:hypothetical protein
MALEVEMVPDAQLEHAAARHGPRCAEAKVLVSLREMRAKDRQFYAFRCGEYWTIGPNPDAETELAMIEVAEELAAADGHGD